MSDSSWLLVVVLLQVQVVLSSSSNTGAQSERDVPDATGSLYLEHDLPNRKSRFRA